MACSALMVSCTTQTEEGIEGSPGPSRGGVEPAPASSDVAARGEASPVPEVEKSPAKGQISHMDIGTLFQLREEERVLLVDVRPAFFYGLAHIPGAISLPLKKFDGQFPGMQAQFDAAVSEGKVIVLYCTDEDCPDGRRTAAQLSELGYTTSVYKGGWKEWKGSGL